MLKDKVTDFLFIIIHVLHILYFSEYGRADKHSHSVMRFMAKLDDNIMFLCFTQVSCEIMFRIIGKSFFITINVSC